MNIRKLFYNSFIPSFPLSLPLPNLISGFFLISLLLTPFKLTCSLITCPVLLSVYFSFLVIHLPSFQPAILQGDKIYVNI